MHYHIILTERCNLRCKYCYGKSICEDEFDNGLDKKWKYDMKTPCDSEVNLEKINNLLKKGDTLIFYGGEPLVKLKKVKEIIDSIEEKFGQDKIKFCIQTNGFFLRNIPEEYLLKFSKMLVSMDGTKERTDLNRGKGTYDFVLDNIKKIREKGFKGEIVARMVVSDFNSDIYEQVLHIISLIGEGLFDSIHWQIDAGFYKNDYDFENFSRFVLGYNESISNLINFWIEYMNKNKKVLMIYPFVGIFSRLIGLDKEKRLPCGSGYANYTITTSGKLSACPIMNSVEDFYCGSVDEGIKKEINCLGICDGCDYKCVCGGRCLYSNYAKLWPEEGQKLICKTVIHLIESLKEKIPEINKLIENNIILEKDFEYEKYFGPEIIP